jgi:hypothetical protein
MGDNALPYVCAVCRIDNPKYKGIWVAPDIDNPDFKDDPKLYLQKDIKYIGFELWQVGYPPRLSLWLGFGQAPGMYASCSTCPASVLSCIMVLLVCCSQHGLSVIGEHTWGLLLVW